MARQSAAASYLVGVVLALVAAVAVNAQDGSPASAPSPSAVTGAGFALPLSGGVVVCSLLVSLFSLLRH